MDRTSTSPGWLGDGANAGGEPALVLTIAWSLDEPERVGESAVLPKKGTLLLGRGPARPDDGAPRMEFSPLRPGGGAKRTPLAARGISRRQATFAVDGGRIVVKKVGRAETWIDGRRVDEGVAKEGSLVYFENQLLLRIALRPSAALARAAADFPFGGPDHDGIVGESLAAWALRDEIAFYGARGGHALVVGPSGAGKELVARALHRASPRRAAPFVARSAPTMPESLVDAELFGNVRGYPNPGMRERAGLVGEAEGGTLFLDEIGEIPDAVQAHLLRLLDGGEYHRLGDARVRTADVRVVAATNRDASLLKPDLVARFPLRLDVPGLDARRDDVPLLARAILRKLAATDAEIRARYFEGDEPRIDPHLVAALLEQAWTTHARELEAILVQAMAESSGRYVALGPKVRDRLARRTSNEAPTADEIRAAIERAGGNVSKAWQDLGLSSRDALNRLLKKHRIVVARR